MIIVDKALEERAASGNPIRVGMIGAGFMGRGIALQIAMAVPGMELVAIANRSLNNAAQAYVEAGTETSVRVDSAFELEKQIAAGHACITDNPFLLANAGNIDAIIEVTGAVEYSAPVVMDAIKNGKHVVLMNAELDGTIGPLLKYHADKSGVVVTNADGDQPGVTMNLYRFVRGLGVNPVLCGNIKGLQDPYRNPTTQSEFAEQWGQKPHMVTSFADGSKISFEQAIVANGTGMQVGQRGMFGPTVPSGTPLEEVVDLYPIDVLLQGAGIVDYVVGAHPGPGVFVLGTQDHPRQKHYLNLYKLGEGPLYLFYTPYHLCHFEAPYSAARAVLFNDATLTPLAGPKVEVVTTAKSDLSEGTTLDGIGYYMSYGQCENADVTAKDRLLPMGLAEGCVLKRPIAQDQVLTYDDVVLPTGRIQQYRKQQDEMFFGRQEPHNNSQQQISEPNRHGQ